MFNYRRHDSQKPPSSVLEQIRLTTRRRNPRSICGINKDKTTGKAAAVDRYTETSLWPAILGILFYGMDILSFSILISSHYAGTWSPLRPLSSFMMPCISGTDRVPSPSPPSPYHSSETSWLIPALASTPNHLQAIRLSLALSKPTRTV